MRVVMLMGPSSAGKSSLCRELAVKYGWKVVSGDDVVSKILDERAVKLNPEVTAALKQHGLIEKLGMLVSEKDILTLANIGILNISKGSHLIAGQGFINPDLPDLESILKKPDSTRLKFQSLQAIFVG